VIALDKAPPGRFCWVDLATVDSAKARAFYAELFGWRAAEKRANGGSFSLLQLAGENVGSMYQLDRAHRERGVPSHWTPYVRVDDIEQTVRRVAQLGGAVLASPLHVHGIAQIALIVDPAGAAMGLWQPDEKGER
jgi:predicted enzyme related to lactoylglutathione lyase